MFDHPIYKRLQKPFHHDVKNNGFVKRPDFSTPLPPPIKGKDNF